MRSVSLVIHFESSEAKKHCRQGCLVGSYPAMNPPSTTSDVPTVNFAFSEQRQRTAAATCLAVPTRPTEIIPVICSAAFPAKRLIFGAVLIVPFRPYRP